MWILSLFELIVYSFPAILILLAPWQLQCEAVSGRVDVALF